MQSVGVATQKPAFFSTRSPGSQATAGNWFVFRIVGWAIEQQQPNVWFAYRFDFYNPLHRFHTITEIHHTTEEMKFCNVTFLTVGDIGPDGQMIDRLQCCSSCKETYYLGQKEQRAHWKVHKKVCKPVQEKIEESVFQQYPMANTLLALGVALMCDRSGEFSNKAILGHAVVSFLRRAQQLCTSNYTYSGQNEASIWDTVCDKATDLKKVPNKTIELFWAIPGMTTFLLNVDLKSSVMRQRQVLGRPPTSQENDFQGFNPAFQLPHQFPCLVAYLLFFSFAKKSATANIVFDYRNTPLAAAAARKMMDLYKDPYTRVSIPWMNTLPESYCASPREQVFPKAFEFLTQTKQQVGDPRNDLAFAPGLSVAEAITMLADDPVWALTARALAPLIAMAITGSSVSKPELWDALADYDRAVAAHKVVGRFILPLNDPVNPLQDEHLQMCGGILMGHLTGYNFHTKHGDATIWFRVMKLGMRAENPLGPQMNYFQSQFGTHYETAREQFEAYLQESVAHGLPESVVPVDIPVLMHNIVEFALEPWAGDET